MALKAIFAGAAYIFELILPPVADAGADQTFDEGTLGVMLDGSGSTNDSVW